MLDTVVFVDSSVREYFTNEMVLVKVNEIGRASCRERV